MIRFFLIYLKVLRRNSVNVKTLYRGFTSYSYEANIVVHRSLETLSSHLTFSLNVMETYSSLSHIIPLKMKIPFEQETFHYFIDYLPLKDYDLLIWAAKK